MGTGITQAVPKSTGAILKTIVNKNSRSQFLCHHTLDELTSLCPKTLIPDFYKLGIDYVPSGLLVELKSLKLYADQFRQREIFHEELLNEFFRDFTAVVRPSWLRMSLEVNVRGGIRTLVTRESVTKAGTLLGVSPEGLRRP
jgi:7-cyano-7-deazaguanine reductase